MQTTDASNFSWYTGSAVQPTVQPIAQPDSFVQPDIHSFQPDVPSFQPTQQFQQEQHFQDHQNVVVPRGHDGNIIINANNVIIENEGNTHHEGPIEVKKEEMKSDAKKTEVTHMETHKDDGTKEVTHTETHKDNELKNGNPLGVPSPHHTESTSQPTNTEKSTATTSKPADSGNSNPLGIPPVHKSDAAPAPSTAGNAPAPLAPAPTTSGAPTTVKSTTTTTPNATTTTTTTAPTKPEKKKKEHKSLKTRFHDWKASRHGGGSANSSVHPKDSRDGKVLPSEDELSQRTLAPGEHAGGATKDETLQSVTGSTANPSKNSVPFKVPEPGLSHQAPVEAKSK